MAMTLPKRVGRAALMLPVVATLVACADATAPTGDVPARYITARRHWRPGERDSLIAHVMATKAWVFFYVGDLSPYAAQILADTDSVTVVVPNPAYAPAAADVASLVLGAQFQAGWNILGIDQWEINNDQVPPDTTRWVGVLWSNPADQTWKGWAIAATSSAAAVATITPIGINTTAFDAAGGKSGAAAAEARTFDGTYWQDNSGAAGPNNKMQISAAAYGAATSVTTGPFLGGTQATGTMLGRLVMLLLPRVQGPTAPATDTVDIDFRFTAITAIQRVCIFPTPCTSNVPGLMAEPVRKYRLANPTAPAPSP